jgi:hypothetical protein
VIRRSLLLLVALAGLPLSLRAVEPEEWTPWESSNCTTDHVITMTRARYFRAGNDFNFEFEFHNVSSKTLHDVEFYWVNKDTGEKLLVATETVPPGETWDLYHAVPIPPSGEAHSHWNFKLNASDL